MKNRLLWGREFRMLVLVTALASGLGMVSAPPCKWGHEDCPVSETM